MSLPPEIRVSWGEVPDGMPRRPVSRALLAALLPGLPVQQRCARCGADDHGRLRVGGGTAVASVSYAGPWAVAATAPAAFASAIGIDAVMAGAAGLERVLPPPSDSGMWARLEAVVKADGRGLRVDPARVRVEGETDAWTAWIDGGDRGLRGWDVVGPPGLRIAVAMRPPRA